MINVGRIQRSRGHRGMGNEDQVSPRVHVAVRERGPMPNREIGGDRRLVCVLCVMHMLCVCACVCSMVCVCMRVLCVCCMCMLCAYTLHQVAFLSLGTATLRHHFP